MKRRTTAALRPAVAVIAVAALVAGCSSATDGSDGGDSDSNSLDTTTLKEGMLNVTEGGDPVDGGTLRFGAFAEPRSLDPAVTIVAGTTGGIEMANIDDTLMRFDAKEQDFVPELAESLEPDAEHDTWTLTLRDGVKFSNGDTLDAAAVKASQERYASMPAPETALWAASVKKISTPDDHTVVYDLKKSWPGFPTILSTGPGMIVDADDVGKDENFKPIGAGPFTLDSWSPQEKMVLAANPDYWGGKPHLDSFAIVYIGDQQTGLDTMKSGGLDANFVRDPDKVEAAVEAGLGGYVNMVAASNMALINAAEGHPGADPRVRQAMQLAIDPQVMMSRAFNGAGEGGSTLFADYSRWHTETEGLAQDQEKAKQLLEEAKADGYDGKVEYIEASDPGSRASALAFKAQLEAVGFEVKLNLMRTIADQIAAIVVDKSYDVAAWGLNFREADPFSKMYSTMHSSGTQTYNMYTSPEMDALIDEFQSTTSTEDGVAVMEKIQQKLNEDVPFLNYGPFAEVTFWNKDVHGIVGAANSTFMANEAWIG
jgi:peptide/nickel transport system substrate-binding protein